MSGQHAGATAIVKLANIRQRKLKSIFQIMQANYKSLSVDAVYNETNATA
jgi:hypothetical protein